MSLTSRLAWAMLIIVIATGFVLLAGSPRAVPAAARTDPVERGSPQETAGAPTARPTNTPSEPRPSPRLRQPPVRGPQGPSVVPRPPASLDGVALTPGRWVMPMAPRSYRVGCAYACYVSDGGLPHSGQDFPAAVGTPVRTVGAGVVVRSESIYVQEGQKLYCSTLPICGANWTSYGNFVQIRDSADPTLTVWYAHLATRRVAVGQRVAAGQPIGTVGSVGNSDGPHLHFEIRRSDRFEDPMPVLRARGGVPQPGPVPAPPPTPAAP